jgi:uncharacterized protein (UPF0332 family)
MNESDRFERIKYRITQAETALTEANGIKDLGYLSAALNRYYYACFYAVTALLLTRELNPKTHAGVRTLFSLHFVQTGIVPLELGQFFGQLFDKRQRSDYDDYINVDKETLDNFSVLTIEFVAIIKNTIF